MGTNQAPYKLFGDALRKLRASAARTPAEVSGAVEIDQSRLESYEKGEQRPPEDILHLLIQHFSVKGDKADELWKLAGYSSVPTVDQIFSNDQFGDISELTVQVAPQDSRIVYTDMIQVMINNYGVIMNFMQGASPGTQPLAVARVGMSKEHARTIIEVLQKTLDQADNPPQPPQQKQLSSGEKKS